jgi:hypothetical protein
VRSDPVRHGGPQFQRTRHFDSYGELVEADDSKESAVAHIRASCSCSSSHVATTTMYFP